jgi:thiamine-monophosphate kinase
VVSDVPILGPGREFDAIRALVAAWGTAAQGIGDDAAALDVPPGERLVVSTDTSVENVHFRREWLTPAEIGWRATMAALSDLAAMGARPLGVLSAITVPVSWQGALGDIGDGIGEAVNAANTKIIGGDLSAGGELSITVTVLGSASHALTRSDARPGDSLYVSGALGGPALALRSWLAGEAPNAAARQRFAMPHARLAFGCGLSALGCTSAIDVSDGLIADARHLAAASNVMITIDLDAIPRFPGASAADAASSGEEYELLVTAPSLTLRDFTCIGTVGAPGEKPGVIVMSGGARVEFAGGYDHFSP